LSTQHNTFNFPLSLATKRPRVNEFEITEVEWKNSHEREWHHKTKFKDKKLNKWRPKAKKLWLSENPTLNLIIALGYENPHKWVWHYIFTQILKAFNIRVLSINCCSTSTIAYNVKLYLTLDTLIYLPQLWDSPHPGSAIGNHFYFPIKLNQTMIQSLNLIGEPKVDREQPHQWK